MILKKTYQLSTLGSITLISLLFNSLLFNSLPATALEIGDTISPEIARKLNIPEGKVAVVDFFASWCASCAQEIPDLKKYISTETSGKTLVMGVDVDKKLSDAISFQKKLSIDFPVYNDTEQKVIQHFNPIGMPALYYVKDNKIIGKRIGAIDEIGHKIKSDLKKLGVK